TTCDASPEAKRSRAATVRGAISSLGRDIIAANCSGRGSRHGPPEFCSGEPPERFGSFYTPLCGADPVVLQQEVHEDEADADACKAAHQHHRHDPHLSPGP